MNFKNYLKEVLDLKFRKKITYKQINFFYMGYLKIQCKVDVISCPYS